MMIFRKAVAAASFCALVLPATVTPAATTTTRSCALPRFGPGSDYHPRIRPADFSPNVDNSLFPLKPGRTFVYTGTKDAKLALDLFVPSSRTRVIDGVRTRVVQDRLYLDNVLEERTRDYYAQDRCGNVWYFGEDTAELDRTGRVLDRSGSFHAGVDGAQPGVIMQAHPQLNRRFRQEWYRGEAEDTYVARDLSTPITVPAGSFRHALRTEEFTRLEPNVLDNKYYVQGIGEVKEVSVKGPLERLVLVEVIR
jgi:hypothetical protein